MKRVEKGFTLVEIMIVVAIIALLAAIAIPNVLRGRATANETAAIGNMRALLSSLEMYRSVNSAYPTSWGSMTTANPPFYPQPFSGNSSVIAQTVQGFIYAYTGTGANNYLITAVPSSASSGGRQFFVNETGRVFHCSSTSTTPGALPTTSIDGPPASTCP